MEVIFNWAATSAIKRDGKNKELVGINVSVVKLKDNIWDVYIHNTKNTTEEITPLKLKKIYNTLPNEIKLYELTGEGYFQTEDVNWLNEWLQNNRELLGIKKRKIMSDNWISPFSKIKHK